MATNGTHPSPSNVTPEKAHVVSPSSDKKRKRGEDVDNVTLPAYRGAQLQTEILEILKESVHHV